MQIAQQKIDSSVFLYRLEYNAFIADRDFVVTPETQRSLNLQ